MWYQKVIGGDRCPIVDTWWQTGDRRDPHHAAPRASRQAEARLGHGRVPRRRGRRVRRDQETRCRSAAAGTSCSSSPGRRSLRTIWNDPDRYVSTYFGKYGDKIYLAGDGAKRDEEGYYWLLGRTDDVMNVAGHRLSTYEIESALVDNPKVAEAAVVSRPDELVGEAIVAFVTLKSRHRGRRRGGEGAAGARRRAKIGKIARPHGIIFTDDLPKTRSGKIMRRLLRDVAHGRPLGDVTTLANAEIVEQIHEMVEQPARGATNSAALDAHRARGGVRPLGAGGTVRLGRPRRRAARRADLPGARRRQLCLRVRPQRRRSGFLRRTLRCAIVFDYYVEDWNLNHQVQIRGTATIVEDGPELGARARRFSTRSSAQYEPMFPITPGESLMVDVDDRARHQRGLLGTRRAPTVAARGPACHEPARFLGTMR